MSEDGFGRRLDAEVCAALFHVNVWQDREGEWLCGSEITAVPVPRYSVDYEAAMTEIPRRLLQLGLRVSLVYHGDEWQASAVGRWQPETSASAPRSPLALCRLVMALGLMRESLRGSG